MKTKSWILTILACFIGAIGYATEFPKMDLTPVEGEKVRLAYFSPQAANLEVSLIDSYGAIIYMKRTMKKESEFNKVFDFSSVEDGTYCICVNYGNKSISRELVVKNNQFKIGDPVSCFEPYFRMENEMLNISLLNSPLKQVYVNVYKNGEHVNGYSLGKDLDIQKKLDFSDLEPGEYEVVLSDYFKDHKF